MEPLNHGSSIEPWNYQIKNQKKYHGTMELWNNHRIMEHQTMEETSNQRTMKPRNHGTTIELQNHGRSMGP